MRRPDRDDAGTTLVELLVVMVLMSVVGTITLTALVGAAKSQRRITDDSDGLKDVQVVTERLARDLRQARGVDSTATASRLTVWVDDNSDFVQTPSETVTWCLRSGAGCVTGSPTGSHYDVIRFTAAAPTVQRVVGRSVVDQLAFTYDGSPVSASTMVSARLQYDAVPGAAARPRQVQIKVRMRNVS